MKKFKVVGDNSSNPFHSSRIIIDATNKAAQKLGIYAEDELTVVYDILCNSHRHKADAFWSGYEMPYPDIILKQANNKPIIGLSKDNAWFILEGGYNPNLVDWVSLGVDTSIWTPIKKKYMLDKFVVLCMTESTVRCGLECLIPAFGEVFKGNKNAVLYIKDRNATDTFKAYVRSMATFYDIEIIHDDTHTENHEIEKEILAHADCHFYLSHSATWGMTMSQSLACGIPVATCHYSGPTDYISHELTGLAVEYDLAEVDDFKIKQLESLGMKNFLFPRRFYKNAPYWAEPRKNSIKDCLSALYHSKELREKLSYNGIAASKTMSWERTAWNMQFVLNKFNN